MTHRLITVEGDIVAYADYDTLHEALAKAPAGGAWQIVDISSGLAVAVSQSQHIRLAQIRDKTYPAYEITGSIKGGHVKRRYVCKTEEEARSYIAEMVALNLFWTITVIYGEYDDYKNIIASGNARMDGGA